MMRKSRGVIILIALGVLGGCHDTAGPTLAELPRDTTAAFQTDSLSYQLGTTSIGYEGTISVVFTNPTGQPVHIVNCGGATLLALEKLIQAVWQGVWSPVIPLCLSPPIVVLPGAQHRSVVRVLAPYPSNNVHPKFTVATIPGVYRLVWLSVLRTYDDRGRPFGEPLPLEQRVSNRFMLSTSLATSEYA